MLMTTVPDVIGIATQGAVVLINAAHLHAHLNNSPPSPSRVESQQPVGETTVAQGSTVKLTLVHGLPP
jgi:hypothetical protein